MNNDEWNSSIRNFHTEVCEIEDIAVTCIEKSFQKLRSAEAAFDLVERFRDLQSRPIIHKRISERYTDILEQYMSELGHIEGLFHSQKENPFIFKSFPQIAGSIVWAVDLYHRCVL